MNDLIFNDIKNPLYVFQDNSIKSLSSFGKIFSVSKTNISFGLLLSTNHTIKITNSSSLNKTIYLTKFTIASTTSTLFKTQISVISGGTLNSGSPLTPINNNCAFSNSSVANVVYNNVASSGGNLIFEDIANVISYTKYFNATVCIPPNSNMLLEIQNLLSITQNVSVIIYWYEI